jgi:adenylate cyclase
VSDVVHVQIKGKVGVEFVNAGELMLKNIAAPVQAWRWGGNSAAIAQTHTPVEGAKDAPSIAVLPFTNMSGDPEQEYFSDGISEDIITDLSKVSGLIVIARNSSFAYKGKTPDIRAVGRELGVSSVLEGSVRRAGNRVRITAQLIDAKTAAHLWAERYDRDLTDIFAVQDEVTLQIVDALKVSLKPAERAVLVEQPTSSVDAHDFFLRGRELWLELVHGSGSHREVFERAVAAFKRATEIDPGYAAPYAGLSLLHTLEYQNRWLEMPRSLDLAVRFAAQAVEMDPKEPLAHLAVAASSLFNGDPEGTKAAAEKALVLSPNFALAAGALGHAETMLGNPQAGIKALELALRLDPIFTPATLHFLGTAYLVAGQYEAAAARLSERIRLTPTTDFSRAYYASALGHLGEVAEAQRVWQALKEDQPEVLVRGAHRPASLAQSCGSGADPGRSGKSGTSRMTEPHAQRCLATILAVDKDSARRDKSGADARRK